MIQYHILLLAIVCASGTLNCWFGVHCVAVIDRLLLIETRNKKGTYDLAEPISEWLRPREVRVVSGKI